MRWVHKSLFIGSRQFLYLHFTTVSKLRMINQLGKIDREDMWQVERTIRVQLALSDQNQNEA